MYRNDKLLFKCEIQVYRGGVMSVMDAEFDIQVVLFLKSDAFWDFVQPNVTLTRSEVNR